MLRAARGVLAREVGSRMGSSGRVAVIDPSPGMVAVAKQLAPAVEWREGAPNHSRSLIDRSFDVVVCQFGLMFFKDRRQALLETLRPSLDNIPAYASEVALLEQTAGRRAADALRTPFVLGSVASVEITTHHGAAHFPNIRNMVEADLMGWLPVMGVILAEDQIACILREAEHPLSSYAASDGWVTFRLSVHLVTAKNLSMLRQASWKPSIFG